MRLRNDNDSKDQSGLLIAKDPLYRSIPKIILTRYPTIVAVREALGPSLEGLPPAVDFIDKRETDLQMMLRAIDNAFEQHERINFALKIDWSQPLSFPALINLLQPEHDNTRLLERCAELEDLLRKLFYESSQITIGRVLKHSRDRIVVEIFAYSGAGVERQYVVSCGKKIEILAELQRYKDVVPQAMGNHSTFKALEAETLRFAATAYMLNGGDLEEITAFRDYYQSKPAETIATCIEQLFHATLASWSRRGRTQVIDQPMSTLLLDAFNLDPEQLALDTLGRQIEAIGQQMLAAGLVRSIEINPTQITLEFHSGNNWVGHNPAVDHIEQRLNTKLSVIRGIIHGQVDANSILVDNQGQTWLIDFARAGWGLLLQDFVMLETAIKLELFDILDIEQAYSLEQQLLATETLGEAFIGSALIPELQRALLAITHIRNSAATLASVQIEAYQAGLLFCALNFLSTYRAELRYSRRRLMPYVHALIQAALLFEKLSSTALSPTNLSAQPRSGLWIDDTNQVAWLTGHRIDLTTQEFQILAFLSFRSGTLCTRQEIADHVLGIDYDISEESRLNNAISRLRRKIEPDPKKARYLITVRGRGYRLDLPKHD